ncbi:MAG: hypothetical protein JNK88_11805 [Mangrovicoccus sp.]|nr:hypothetical protein [Mangrovicoccus sp.]
MAIVVTALSVLAFIAAFEFLGILPKAREAIAISQRTAAVMGDSTLGEEAKEKAVQQAALNLMKGFFGLLLRIIGIILAAYVPIFLADFTGLLPEAEALAFMLRLDVIAVTSVLMIAVIWLAARVRPR